MDILGFLKKIWDPGRMSLRLTLPSIPAYGVSVKSMKFSLRLVLLVSFAGVFSGCTGGNFLIGKWTFDSDKTLEAIQSATTPEPDPENPAGGILKGIVGGLQKGLSMVVVSQMEGLDIEFTREEIRRVRKGAGESQGYEIIEKVSPDRDLVKYDDGEIVSWQRTETGIKMLLASEEEIWVYFQPVER